MHDFQNKNRGFPGSLGTYEKMAWWEHLRHLLLLPTSDKIQPRFIGPLIVKLMIDDIRRFSINYLVHVTGIAGSRPQANISLYNIHVAM